MLLNELSSILVEQHAIPSHFLRRYVIVDICRPKVFSPPSKPLLLVLNDGQHLDEISLPLWLDEQSADASLVCVGVYCSKDRIDEYGTAAMPDYAGRGTKAGAYQQFLIDELLPFLHNRLSLPAFHQKAIAGFSMGGLSALDTLWNYPGKFSVAAVFSGSFWWRSKDLGEGYSDEQHRIMHQLIRSKTYQPGKRFYFTTGSFDETADRNNNGVIDSIDDTLDLISELERLGYRCGKEITYLNDPEGRHDIATWGRALPAFLSWLAAPRIRVESEICR